MTVLLVTGVRRVFDASRRGDLVARRFYATNILQARLGTPHPFADDDAVFGAREGV
jgi:hypothetical protein